MFHSPKPYSAVSVHIEALTGDQYDVEESSGIPDLIEAINIQGTGPTEASRALRKKLKYGNLHRQLRALTILDFLIQNAGERFLREFADEPLLERLRIAATDPVSDPQVKQKCKQLFAQWAVTYKDTPGMGKITALYRQLPKRKQPATIAKAKVLRETGTSNGPVMGHSVSVSAGSGPTTVLSGPKQKPVKAPKKDRRTHERKFSLEKERPEILQTIASSSVASTNLLNALKLVNRESQRVSDDAEVLHLFDTCKQLRRQILRYIQCVESEEFLGGLIHANEELVTALMAFEVLDKNADLDSDSDQDVLEVNWTGGGLGRSGDNDDASESFSGLSLNPPKPPRPARPTSLAIASAPASSSRAADSDTESEQDEEDEDNPFGDRNAIKTPALEKTGLNW